MSHNVYLWLLLVTFSLVSTENFNYFMVRQRRDFAEYTCQSMGMMTLPKFESIEEEAAAYDHVNLYNLPSSLKVGVWIGLHGNSSEELTWTDGSHPNYTNWAPGEPYFGNENVTYNCAYAKEAGNGTLWFMTHCNHTRTVLCENYNASEAGNIIPAEPPGSLYGFAIKSKTAHLVGSKETKDARFTLTDDELPVQDMDASIALKPTDIIEECMRICHRKTTCKRAVFIHFWVKWTQAKYCRLYQ